MGEHGVDYEALTLIEGCLVTQPIDIWPGLGIWPVDAGGHRHGVAVIMDSILANAGWEPRVSGSRWAVSDSTNLPLALIQSVVPSDSLDEARRMNRIWVDTIVSALALHRGAAAQALVTVMRRNGDDQAEYLVESQTPLYRGNLFGGSGETPAAIAATLTAATDPLVHLWLTAYRDAVREPNPDVEIHRWWNLAEAITTTHDYKGTPVLDDNGEPIVRTDSEKPVTPGSAIASVYLHVQRVLDERNIWWGSFPRRGDRLWDFVVAWYGLRNAVAHHGALRTTNGTQPHQWWYLTTVAYHDWNRAQGHPFLHNVREAATLILEHEIRTRQPDLPLDQ